MRQAGRRLQSRTLPLFRETAKASLRAAFDAGAAAKPVGVWGGLAVRQQELRVPTEEATAVLVDEARRLLTNALSDAARTQQGGRADAARAALLSIVRFANFFGSMLEVAAVERAGLSPTELAERFLGALVLPPDLVDAANALAGAAAAGGGDGADELEAAASTTLRAMLSLISAEFAEARSRYTRRIESVINGGKFDRGASRELDSLAKQLALPHALSSKLGLDAYYGWLVDLAESMDRRAVSSAREVRACLRVEGAGRVELYANTDVDELVLNAACDELLAQGSPLSPKGVQDIETIEVALEARPGVAAAIVAKAGVA